MTHPQKPGTAPIYGTGTVTGPVELAEQEAPAPNPALMHGSQAGLIEFVAHEEPPKPAK